MNSTPSAAGEPGQVLVHDVVLALALGEVHPRHPLLAAKRCIAATNASVIGSSGAVEAIGSRRWPRSSPTPAGVLQLRHVDVEIHPVDALHLEHHVIVEDIGDAAR
jgi:hypothetical protein